MRHLLPAYPADGGAGAGVKVRPGAIPESVSEDAARCAFAAAGLAGEFYSDSGPVHELRSKVEERFLPAWRRRAATRLTDGFWSVEGNCAGRPGQAGSVQEGD